MNGPMIEPAGALKLLGVIFRLGGGASKRSLGYDVVHDRYHFGPERSGSESLTT